MMRLMLFLVRRLEWVLFAALACNGGEAPAHKGDDTPSKRENGSKAADPPITRIVVELKSELEKLREQVLNVE